MFDVIKLKLEIQGLRNQINTIENRYETLKDERIDKLIAVLDKKNHYEELEEENKKLKIKNQQLKEVIKELSNVKNKR